MNVERRELKRAAGRSLFYVFICFLSITLPIVAQDNPAAITPEKIAGEWTISDSNPTGGCRLSLEVVKDPFGFPAHVFGCTAADLLQVTRWSLRGTSIALSDERGAIVVLLKIKDRNRYYGRSVSGRKIVLSR